MKTIKPLLLLFTVALTACSTVTVNPASSGKLDSTPSYEESKSFYIWGLVGEHRINVKEVCGDREVLQMQSQQTFRDGFWGVITLGIYAPHSVKVWCS